MEKKSGFGKFLAGAAIGAGLGVLFAPKSGKETRKDIAETAAFLASDKASYITGQVISVDGGMI